MAEQEGDQFASRRIVGVGIVRLPHDDKVAAAAQLQRNEHRWRRIGQAEVRTRIFSRQREGVYFVHDAR
jgi:hypothetical protein